MSPLLTLEYACTEFDRLFHFPFRSNLSDGSIVRDSVGLQDDTTKLKWILGPLANVLSTGFSVTFDMNYYVSKFIPGSYV